MDQREQVTIYEVGPRDGLQFESQFFPTDRKIELINLLSASGLKKIEATSFVHPKAVPQLRDAAEVMARIDKQAGVTYSVLVPNLKGCQAALASRADEFTLFVSASPTHNRKNVGMSIADSLAGFPEIARLASEAGKSLRGYVITAFGCPYEGAVSLDNVRRIMEVYARLGVREASLGDTTGMANPPQVQRLVAELRRGFPEVNLAAHFHDSRGTGLVNTYAAFAAGVRVFDSSIGGLGGCPFAKGAAGNVPTEDTVNLCEEMGLDTGVDFDKLLQAAALVREVLGRELASGTSRVGRPRWSPGGQGESHCLPA
ncbi:MAG: hydroxymethylglutaryl-CoA lyase [Desulfarculus sp.]|nr:MAG: hydroxymethylglutaryl-CoA lyase [Desulfarculus sp.]